MATKVDVLRWSRPVTVETINERRGRESSQYQVLNLLLLSDSQLGNLPYFSDKASMKGAEDEQDEEHNFMLGFTEPPKSAYHLLRHQFRSKVGGRPAWLNPAALPTRHQLTCGPTQQPLDFLLQIYAPPPEELQHAFHRAIFVFTSPAGLQLTKAGAVKAFRCQLPRENPFYSAKPPKDSDQLPPPVDLELPAVQQDRWQSAAAEQALPKTVAMLEVPLYKELELIVDAEPWGTDSEDDAHTQQLMSEYQARLASEGPLDAEALPPEVLDAIEDSHSQESQQFAEFAARLASAPEQVLRYCSEDGAQPLWPSLAYVPEPDSIPACPLCGAARRFEFQILPQLLHFMQVDASSPDSIDFGSIAVFTCSNSCNITTPAAPSAYAEEYVWVQPS